MHFLSNHKQRAVFNERNTSMKYTQAFKDHVLARYTSGEPTAQILNDTGISKATLYDWINKYTEQQKSDEINPNMIRQQQRECETLQCCV